MPLPPGTALGPYRVTAKIGQGGMGEVYKAQDTRLDRIVAIKIVLVDRDQPTRPEDLRRLQREARAVAALTHPHICVVHDVGEHDGQPFIVMEYLEGCSLSRLIPADGLVFDAVLRYGGQIADALAHAHSRGIVHRDLKASNVVFDAAGEPKVLDFGLARRTWRAARGSERATEHVTSSGGRVAGTVPYMPPEVLQGRPGDERGDIWSLGILLSRMASGRMPFTGATDWETIAAIQRDPPAPLPATLPPSFRQVVGRCLAKEPARRYERASEVRAALESIDADVAAGRNTRTGAPVVPRVAVDAGTTPTARSAGMSRSRSGLDEQADPGSESLRRIERRVAVLAGVARLIAVGVVATVVLGLFGFVTGMTFHLALQIPSIPAPDEAVILGARAMIPAVFWMLLDVVAVAIALGLIRLLIAAVRTTARGRAVHDRSRHRLAELARRVAAADPVSTATTFGVAAVTAVLALGRFAWPLFAAIEQMIEQPPGTVIDTSILGTANEGFHNLVSWAGATLALCVGVGCILIFRASATAEARPIVTVFKVVSAAAVVCALLIPIVPWRLVWISDGEEVTYAGRRAFIVSERADRLSLWVVVPPGGMAVNVAADDPGLDRQGAAPLEKIFDPVS